MDGHLSDVQRLLKNGHTSDSFAAHFKQHLKSNTSCKDLHKCMQFKVANRINPIGAMKSFMKPN